MSDNPFGFVDVYDFRLWPLLALAPPSYTGCPRMGFHTTNPPMPANDDDDNPTDEALAGSIGAPGA